MVTVLVFCHDNGSWKLVQCWYMIIELVGLNTPAKVDGLIGKEYCTFAVNCSEYGDVGNPKTLKIADETKLVCERG